MEMVNSPSSLFKAIIKEKVYGGKKIGELFSSDRAQSRFFTVTVDSLSSSNILVGVNKDIEALPVKNINYNITGIDTMSLSIGVFKDIPIPTGKKLPKITLTLIDDRMDQLETSIRYWCDTMIPSGTGIVGYLDEMITTLTYISYDTCGQENFSYIASVMFTDEITLSRDAETNELKAIEISLIILEDDIKVVNELKGIPKPKVIKEPTAPKPPTVLPGNNTNFAPQPIELNNGPISTEAPISQPQPIFNI